MACLAQSARFKFTSALKTTHNHAHEHFPLSVSHSKSRLEAAIGPVFAAGRIFTANPLSGQPLVEWRRPFFVI